MSTDYPHDATPDPPRHPAPYDPELARMARLGLWLAASEKPDPDAKDKGAAAALRLMLARELGLPLRAASELAIIRGRLVISSQLLRALAHREGYRVVRVAGDAESCTAAVLDRDGQELGRATYTREQARAAGLVKQGGAWTMYPERMLWARAAAWAIRDTIPEVALGLVAHEGIAADGLPADEEVVIDHDPEEEGA